MKAIPVVVRERIMTLYGQGKSTEQIAAALGYCVAAVRRVRQHFRERGTLMPQTHLCGAKGYFTPQRQAYLRTLVAQRPDATLGELGARMDVHVPTSTMDTWVRRLGLTFKKSPCGPPSRTGPMSPKRGPAGTASSKTSRRTGSSSLTNRGCKPT
jgi:transposase